MTKKVEVKPKAEEEEPICKSCGRGRVCTITPAGIKFLSCSDYLKKDEVKA